MSCKLLKFSWISVFLIFINGHCFAQKTSGLPADSSASSMEDDSSSADYTNVTDTLIIKTPFTSASDSIMKWKQGREFGYMAYLDSLLKKKRDLKIDTINIDKGTEHKNTISNSADNSSSNSFLNSSGVRIFFWIVAIFFVGFIVYKIFFTGGLFSRGPAGTREEPAHKEPEILSDFSEYNALIREAELKSNFNLSVRYLYLQSLKKLADNELIIFSPDKTNNLYIQELSGRNFKAPFAFLTRNYEYVWYGKFNIDRPQYQKLKDEFISFNKNL